MLFSTDIDHSALPIKDRILPSEFFYLKSQLNETTNRYDYGKPPKILKCLLVAKQTRQNKRTNQTILKGERERSGVTNN